MSAEDNLMAVQHKCFISYDAADMQAVGGFLDEFNDVFIPKAIGVSDADDFINSDNREYVMRGIREKYLSDSTVTIVLIGRCTKARKYVDWEIASSLRNDPLNGRSGLLGINLRSMGESGAAPDRLRDNLESDDSGYARYYVYPNSPSMLRTWIQEAFEQRSTQAPNNSRDLFKNNRQCD